jgi:lysophospholipase L1-like esterase
MNFTSVMKLKIKTIKLKFAATCLIILAASAAFSQNEQISTERQTKPPLNTQTEAPLNRQSKAPIKMLVLGDSIIWGQGLKKEHKSWYYVKVWLEKTTGQAVVEKIEAHSGALIERSSMTERLTAEDAEVDVALPTLNEELDNALRFYADGSKIDGANVDGAKIDIVLVSGCANDVGTQNLLNATATEQIDDWTLVKCGAPMERLLRRITTAFPAASVIVTGYYPFFSERTRNDFVLKGLVKRFFKIIPGAPKLSSKEILARLTANSNQWYRASNKALSEAVRNVNSALGGERVRFARIEFSPEHSFAGPQSRLWQFNRSPFRMMLVLLSFGKILLPTNDEVRKQRSASCREVFKQQPNETATQKTAREKRRALCRYAALGHPNRKGAVMYADAIIKLLETNAPVSASAP